MVALCQDKVLKRSTYSFLFFEICAKKSNFDFEVKTFHVGLLFFLLPILAKVETLIKVLGTIFYSSYIPLLSGSRKFFESLIFSTAVVVAEKVESNFCVGKREKEGFLIIFLLHTIHQRLCLLVNYIFDALQTTQVQPTIIPKGFHTDPASVAAAPSIYLPRPPILTLEASISSLDQGCPNF